LPGFADTADFMLLEMASGVPVTVSVGTHSFLGNGHRLTFYGSRGTLVLENKTQDYIHGFRLSEGLRPAKCFKDITPPEGSARRKSSKDGRIAAVGGIAGRFLDWIKTGKPARPDFRDGLRVQRLLELAFESSRKNLWVNVRG
jgi:predicted dehydrogenase